MTRHRRRIHWAIPTSMSLAFTAGLVFAIAHHVFNSRLAGRAVPSKDPNFSSTRFDSVRFSQQQVNIAVGTAFAFLVKSSLATDVAISYVQLLWYTLRSSSGRIRLSDADRIFAMLQELQSLFKPSAWQRQFIVLIPMSIIFWLLPLASVFTPATLTTTSAPISPVRSAQTAVAQFDFVNLNFVDTTRDGANRFVYDGPSTFVRRIAAIAAARGEILRIEPPALNASWTLDFYGPAAHCNDVPANSRDLILENFGSSIQQMGETISWLPSYYSWTPHLEDGICCSFLPDIDPASKKPVTSELHGAPTVYIMLIDNVDYSAWTTDDASLEQLGGWKHMLSGTKVISCEMFNSSYIANFKYTNGNQMINVSRPSKSSDTPMIAEQYFYFPFGPEQTWNSTTCQLPKSANGTCLGDGTPCPILYDNPCLAQENAQKLSYETIMDAFIEILQAASDIQRTVLTDTSELSFLLESNTEHQAIRDSQVWAGRLLPPQGSRGPLVETLEHLFENITVSVLSEPSLQPDFSKQAAISPLANVTFEEYHTIYIYDAVTLWVVYGLVLLFAGAATLAGAVALYLNGVAYENKISTSLRTIRISGIPASPMSEDDDDSRNDCDDGSSPLPKALAQAVVALSVRQSGIALATLQP